MTGRLLPANLEGLDPMLWTREVEYEGSERITGKRAFIFCRFGTRGSYRYGGFFSGDLIPEWGNLKVLVPFDVQGGNMLTPYVNNLAVAVYGVTIEPELDQRNRERRRRAVSATFHAAGGGRGQTTATAGNVRGQDYGDGEANIPEAFSTGKRRRSPTVGHVVGGR